MDRQRSTSAPYLVHRKSEDKMPPLGISLVSRLQRRLAVGRLAPHVTGGLEMGKLRYGITLVALLCTVGIVGALALTRTTDSPAPSAEPDFATMINGYSSWTRVNSEPYRMSAAVM